MRRSYAVGLAGALVGVLALAGCTREAGSAPAAVGGSSPSVAVAVPSAESVTVKVAAYGPASPQCRAISSLLDGGSTIGLRASLGKVTVADIEQTFTIENRDALPKEVRPLYSALAALAQGVVGKDAATGKASVGAITTVVGDLARAASTVCAPLPPPKVTPKPSGSGSGSAKPSPGKGSPSPSPSPSKKK